MTPVPQAAAPQRRSNLAGVMLSFLWPGLGQWYLGRRRAAILYGLPVLILAGLVAVQLAQGLSVFAVRLLEPSAALTLLILVLLLGAWRLLAMADAALSPAYRSAPRPRSTGLVALLVAVVIGSHALAAYYAYSFYQAGSAIFVGRTPTGEVPAGESPAPSDPYHVPPFETPHTEAARITILLTGIDKTTDRTNSLTDTMLVTSVDPATGGVAMVTLPRDIAGFPLYSGGVYEGKINSLMSYAEAHPTEFPDGPLPTLAKELSYLLGIPIHYFAAVDLDGFRRMIEAVGGVTVDVDRPIADPLYDWLDGSPPGFYLAAGRQKLNSRTALAYVRSRQGLGDSDYTRAARQQQLLLALRESLTSASNIAKIPAVLDAAATTIRTNFPSNRLDEMVGLAQAIDGDSVRRIVLQPPTYSFHPPENTTGGTWLLRLKWGAIRTLSVELFGSDSTFWTGTFSPSGSPVAIPAP